MAEQKKSEGVSRRDFLRIAGAGGGGLVVGAVAGSQLFPKAAEGAALPQKWGEQADVVVVGAGGGGLAAAIEAAGVGRDVLVLEVMNSALESNTALCGGVVMGAETSIQKQKGISDSIDEFKEYLAAVGEGFEDKEITNVWAERAGETVDWLIEQGVVFPPENLYISGLESNYADVTPPAARGHTTDAHSGRPISEALYKVATDKKVRFLFGTRGTQLVTTRRAASSA